MMMISYNILLFKSNNIGSVYWILYLWKYGRCPQHSLHEVCLSHKKHLLDQLNDSFISQ